MAQVIVRQLEPEVVERLKLHARANGRSLEAELRVMLRTMAQRQTREEGERAAQEFREKLRGRLPNDSTAALREDRDSGHRDDSTRW